MRDFQTHFRNLSLLIHLFQAQITQLVKFFIANLDLLCCLYFTKVPHSKVMF